MTFINILSEYIASNLWATSVQIAVFTVFIWLISLVTWKQSSKFKYLLWCLVLVRLCLPVEIPISLGLENEYLNYLDYPANFVLPEDTTVDNTSENNPEISKILATVWLTVTTGLFLIILFRTLYIGNRVKKSKNVNRKGLIDLVNTLKLRLNIKRKIELRYINNVAEGCGPSVVGFFNIKILLPVWMVETWDIKQIEPVILHELAHIKRNDLIINWIQIIIQVLFFYHPFVWLANRKIRQYREDVCDDIAIQNISSERKKYSLSILNVMEGIMNEKRFVFSGLGFTENKGSLAKRIFRIMSNNYNMKIRLTALSLILLIIIGFFGFVITCKKNVEPESKQEIFSEGSENKPELTGDFKSKYDLINTPELSAYDLKDKNMVIQVSFENDGVPKLTRIVESSGEKKLDDLVSNLFKNRARYKIPEDSDKDLTWTVTYSINFNNFTNREKEEVPTFLPLEDQPKLIGGLESIYKHLEYPEIAKTAQVEGSVVVMVLVGKTGIPEDVSVLRSSGNESLDAAAIEACKKGARYTPAKQEGKAVKYRMSHPVIFRIAEKKQEEEIATFLPLEDQPKLIGGLESIYKHLEYPEIAKKTQVEGSVVVMVLVGKTGIPEDVSVLRSSGNKSLDAAAVEAVEKGARYTPAKQEGKPVKYRMSHPVIFRLKEK